MKRASIAFMMRLPSSAACGLALVEPVGDLVQPAFEIAKQHVALFDGVALAAFEQAGQHVEALLDAWKDLVGRPARPARGRALSAMTAIW